MKGITKAKGVISMLLKDADGKQIVLNQNPLTKDISITVIDKATQKHRTYKNKRMIRKLFAKCI